MRARFRLIHSTFLFLINVNILEFKRYNLLYRISRNHIENHIDIIFSRVILQLAYS